MTFVLYVPLTGRKRVYGSCYHGGRSFDHGQLAELSHSARNVVPDDGDNRIHLRSKN